MIVQPKIRLYVPCPCCRHGEFRVDHLPVGQDVTWSCQERGCGQQVQIIRQEDDVFIRPTGRRQTPITITLRSQTEPPIVVKVNTWKYAHSQNDTQEEFEDHERYFYEEHTCPTNWFSEVEQISVGDDTDPHGLFEFVSVEEGHFKDPNVIEPPERDDSE